MIKMKIDEKDIPMNRYVEDVFEKVILAMVSTLKGIPDDWKQIEIVFERDQE